MHARLSGLVGAAPWRLDADLTMQPAAGAVRLEVDHPFGRGALVAGVAGVDLAHLHGAARVDGSGAVRGLAIGPVVADVALDPGAVRGRVAARAPGGARVDLEAELSYAARPVVVRAARLDAEVAELGALAGPLLGPRAPRGQLSAEVTAAGPIDGLHIAGTVRGAALRMQDLTAAALVATADLSGLPRAPVGHVRVEARRVRRGPTDFGNLRADGDVRDAGRHLQVALAAGDPRLFYGGSARARIDRAPGGPTVIQVGELRVKTRQLTWSGHAGAVMLEPDGGVRVRDVTLASAAGRIRAEGELRAAGDRLLVDVAGLDLGAVRSALAPGARDVRGRVDLHLLLTQRARHLREVQLRVAARALELLPGTAPVALDVDAGLLHGDVHARVNIDGGRTGTAVVDVDARAPADPLDVKAWRRVDENSVHRAHVELVHLDVERFAAILGRGPPPLGVVDASVEVGPRLARVDARVHTAGIAVPDVDGPLSADLTLQVAGGRLTASGGVHRLGGGVATFTARAAVPAHLTRVASWRRLDVRDLEALHVTLKDVEPGSLRSVHDRYPDLAGRLNGTVAVAGASADRVSADLRLTGLRSARLTVPIDARLRTVLRDRETVLDLESTLGDRPLATAHGTLGAGLDALRQRRSDTLAQAPVRVSLRVKDFPLVAVQQALSLPGKADGTLAVNADIGGTASKPQVAFAASVGTSHLGAVAFDHLDARANLGAGQLVASVDTVQQGGGSLRGELRADVHDLRNGKLAVKASRFDLAFLALFATQRGLKVSGGVVDADVSVETSAGRRTPQGWIKLAKGDMRVTDVLATFHDANLDVKLGPGDAVAVKLDSNVGNGGHVTLDGTGQLGGLAPQAVRGTFSTRGLSISAGRIKLSLDSHGRITGDQLPDAYHVGIALEGATVHLPKLSGGGKLHDTGTPQDVAFVDEAGRRAAAKAHAVFPFLHVRLQTERSVLVLSEEVRAEVDVHLDAGIGAEGTVLRGQVRVEDGGFVELFGRRWSFKLSRASFAGDNPPDPELDVGLEHEFRTTTVSIAVTGRSAQPVIALAAEPGDYDQAQILGFVLGGDPDESGAATQGDVSDQALSAGMGLVVAPLLKQVLPVDTVSFKTKSGATEETVFTVGKWFFSDVFVSYQQRFGGEPDLQKNTVEGRLEWYFRHGLRLDVVVGDRGQDSADVLSVFRW
jgi:hypothetical protein